RYRKVRKDACRPEQRVPVTCDYLYLAKALNGGLKFPVEIGECRWPIFEQRRGAADPARVSLIHLTKRPITPRTCPTHKFLLLSRFGLSGGLHVVDKLFFGQ